MIYQLRRDAFSEVYTYQYRLYGEDDALLMIASWPPLTVTDYPPVVYFDDSEGERLGHLAWESRPWWRGDRFQLFEEAQEEECAVIEEHWHIVDRLLLRMPRYVVTLLDGVRFEARGNRYGQDIYELFQLPSVESAGEEETAASPDPLPEAAEAGSPDPDADVICRIVHPAVGPRYALHTETPLFIDHPMYLFAAVVILDLWGLSHE